MGRKRDALLEHTKNSNMGRKLNALLERTKNSNMGRKRDALLERTKNSKMGRKLDALLGRTVKTSKFEPLLALALSRVAVLKTQRQARCTQSRSDVLQLLQLGHHERALLRVGQVIREQNMLDVFVMIERYCNLSIERVHLIEQERECPDELKEAASSMIYAASRCGNFPELQEIRGLLTARYGNEFTAKADELRNHCGVNLIMIQKLSTRMPTMESRMKVLKEIAFENSIVLNLEEASGSVEDKNQAPPQSLASSSGTAGSAEILQSFKEETEKDDKYSKMKYKDVAHAAQAAFESAAYAAVMQDKNQAPPQSLASSSGTAGSAEILQSFKEETEIDDKYSKMKYKDVAHAAQAAFESAAYAAAAARVAVMQDKNQAPPQSLASSSGTAGSAEILQSFKEETEKDDKYSKMKYKDVAHAAQAAFESAAYAAAAVELSRSDSHDSDNQNSPGPKRGKLSARFQSSKTEFGWQSEHITMLESN